MEIFWTNGKGHGLKALEDISDGEFIIEYLGEVVTTKEFTKRSHEYSKQVCFLRRVIFEMVENITL